MDLKHIKQSILQASLSIERCFVNSNFKINPNQVVNNFFSDDFSYTSFNNICFELAPNETLLIFKLRSRSSFSLQLIHMMSHLDGSLLEVGANIQTVGHLVKFHFLADYFFSHKKINYYCRDLFWFSLERIVWNHLKFYTNNKDNSRLVELFLCLCLLQDLVLKKDKWRLKHLIKIVKNKITSKNQTKIELSGMVAVIYRSIKDELYSKGDYSLKHKKKLKNFLKKQSKYWKQICLGVEQNCKYEDVLDLILLQLNTYIKK